jgi:hypothetical protein
MWWWCGGKRVREDFRGGKLMQREIPEHSDMTICPLQGTPACIVISKIAKGTEAR